MKRKLKTSVEITHAKLAAIIDDYMKRTGTSPSDDNRCIARIDASVRVVNGEAMIWPNAANGFKITYESWKE